MNEIGSLIQSGGAETMGMINQSGGIAMFIPPLIRTLVPIIFFFVYFFWHIGLDDSRAERADEDKGDKQYESRKFVLWGKFSLKVLLMMMALCFLFGWILTAYEFLSFISGGPWMQTWWKGAFTLIAISAVITIVFGGLRSTAYQYFVDDLYDDKDKMKNTCVEFGCGYAPHGSEPVVRGIEYK